MRAKPAPINTPEAQDAASRGFSIDAHRLAAPKAAAATSSLPALVTIMPVVKLVGLHWPMSATSQLSPKRQSQSPHRVG